jgi:hypothetical protein
MVVTRCGQSLGRALELVILGTRNVRELAPVPRLNKAGRIVSSLDTLKMFRNAQLILVLVSFIVYL